MKTLLLLNSAPYGSELAYNALRLANALAKRSHNEVRVYLMGDAAAVGRSGQKVPEGHYNLALMLDKLSQHPNSQIAACGSCLDARGIQAGDLLPCVHRGTLEELADWSEWADKMLVF